MFSKSVAACVSLLLCLPVLAQNEEGKNQVKYNLSSLAFKGFNFQYERQVSRKVTVALGYGMIPISSVPYKSYIKTQVFIPDVDIDKFQFGTYIFTPEARYYFGKKGAFHGFYLAPYARIGSYKINGPIQFSTNRGSKQNADFDGKLSAITGGIMAGTSWQLSDKFYLDIWFAGIGFGGESGKFNTKSQLSEEDQVSLKKKLDSISLWGITLTSEVDNNGATVRSSGNVVGVRGIGVNFGIRF